MVFRYYRISLASDIPLPLFHCTPDHHTFSYTVSLQPLANWPWRHAHEIVLSDGTPYLSVTHHNATLRLNFPHQADVLIDTTARTITACPAAEFDPDLLTHLLIDQVLPRLMTTLGYTALHAGGVLVDGGAVLFTGQSGYGKSTMVAGYHHGGYPIISDDVIFIERTEETFTAVSGYPGFRLWPDSAAHHRENGDLPNDSEASTTKQRFVITDSVPSGNGAPIRCIFALTPPYEGSASIRITPLSSTKACMSLLRQMFRLLEPDRDQLATEMSFFADLSNQVPIFSLTYPRSFALLPDVRDAILSHLASLPTRIG